MKLFAVFLVLAAWQDLRSRSLGKGFLLLFGLAGGALCLIEGRTWYLTAGSVSAGILLLLASRLTGGGIGEGDGWFFVVAGLFLKPEETYFLLFSGLFIGSVFGLCMAVFMMGKGGGFRKMRIPFLPFLLPAGLWMCA